MKKFFVLVLVMVVMSAILVGCADVVSERQVTVVAEADYDSAKTVPMYTGKGYIYKTEPAEYHVRYDDQTYHVGSDQGREIVKEYDGEDVIVTFIEKTYDNGFVKYELVSVDGLAA